MTAFFYPEAISFMSILPNGLLACADFLEDPQTEPALLVSFNIVLEDDSEVRVIPFLGVYSSYYDKFAFLGYEQTHANGLLYDLGKHIISLFWPDRLSNPSFYDLYLDFVVGGLDPLSQCEKLTDQEEDQVKIFFDAYYDLADDDRNFAPKRFSWAKENKT